MAPKIVPSLFVFLWAFICICKVASIFEEQAGEFDWNIENIGIVSHSVYKNERLLTATSDSVIASFLAKSGSLEWRVILPSGTKVHQLGTGEGVLIFALTSRLLSSGDISYTISTYNIETGSLVWDQPVKFDDDFTAASGIIGYTDLVVDIPRKVVTVLVGNTIAVYSVFGDNIWSWAPIASDNIQITEQAKAGRVLRITQLAVPLVAGKDTKDAATSTAAKKSIRLAVGCFVSSSDLKSSYATAENPTYLLPVNDATTPVCAATVILSAVPPALASNSMKPVMEVQTFASLPTVAYTSLRASISSDATAALAANDVLFGIARGDSSAKLLVLSLSSNSVKTVDIPNKEAVVSAAAFLLATDDGDVVPAAIFCSASKTCESFAIVPVGKSSAVTSLGSCGSGGGDNYASSSNSRIGLQRHPSYASLSQAIACAETGESKFQESSADDVDTKTCSAGHCTSATAGAGERAAAVRITITSLDSDRSTKTSKTSIEVQVPSAGSSDIHLVAADRFQFDSSSSEHGVRALVVFKTGVTTLIQTDKGSNAGKVLWSRDESLARVKQSVIVEDPRGSILHATTADGEIEKLPELNERLEMQFIELKEMGDRLKSFIDTLPAAISAHASTGFGLFPPAAKKDVYRYKTVGVDVKGKKRRAVQGDLIPREKKIINARKFGFNKIGICLSSSLSAIGGSADVFQPDARRVNGDTVGALGSTDTPSGFSSASLKIVALDLLFGEPLWSFEPSLSDASVIKKGVAAESNSGSSAAAAVDVVFARLLTLHSSPVLAEVALIVGTNDGYTYAWRIDGATGKLLSGPGVSPSAPHAAASVAIASTVVPPVKSQLVSVMALPISTASGKGERHYLLIHEDVQAAAQGIDKVDVTLFPAQGAEPDTVSDEYFHLLDRQLGSLRTFQLSASGPSAAAQVIPVASASFPISFSAVAYHNPNDLVERRYSVLGDNSLLMKYANPNVVLVAYFEDHNAIKSSSDDGSVAPPPELGKKLFATLIDTVSAKILHCTLLSDSAEEPVHAAIVENSFVVTYWNAKAKRTELSSSALFEGMVDKFGLSPVGSFSAVTTLQRDSNHSAFTSPPPLGIQRTYIIPRGVTSLYHTITAKGMAHKSLLVGFTGGLLYSLDHRQVHPRRPMAPPTPGEAEEGLAQYSPFIHLFGQKALTLDSAVAGDVINIATAAAQLESTSLVLAFGGLDIFFTRELPSQGFDVLASDFNHPLLIFLLGMLAAAVLALRRVYYTRNLKASWV